MLTPRLQPEFTVGAKYGLIVHCFVCHQILILILMLAPISVQAETPPNASLVVSGAFADALFSAYAYQARSRSALDAPFALENDAVQLAESQDGILVSFVPNRAAPSITVTTENGVAVSKISGLPVLEEQPILMPGVTAGEIIAAYSTALQRRDRLVQGGATSFHVNVLIGAGVAFVSFVPVIRFPSPEYKCISGNCNGSSTYIVNIQSGKVVVTYKPYS